VILLWQKTAYYANWIETRQRQGRQTTLVTVSEDQREMFVTAAQATTGVTVEEVIGGEEVEDYQLLVGDPGTGWVRDS
jgi:hypothetical protein